MILCHYEATRRKSIIVILGKKLKTCRSENGQEDALFMCLGLGVVRREKMMKGRK